ncbi:MAG TPA: prolyl oligopeptidase family serine peptidase, partial [Pyrinomonadaceae bacterium]|nr:prolyl oligopeptidase family serine peptidase [Pyrinomonadaceae bacterium]
MYAKPKHLLWRILSIAVILFGPVVTARSQGAPNGRPMIPEDLLSLQSIKETAFSPDGKWVAVVVERSKQAGESYERGYLGGLERSDIWLASTDGKKLVNVTRGESLHAGYWNPVWSPDGNRLAMVSTRGSDNVRAYVYDLTTQHLRVCSGDGVDLGMRIETPESNTWTVAWLGRNQLLLGVLPPGTRPLAMDEAERTTRISVKALDDVKRGRGVTARVLDTERVEPSSPQKSVTLRLLDVVTNKTRTVTRIPLIETRLSQRVVSISPDRTYAAILATDYPQTASRDARPSAEDIALLRLGVANLTRTDEAPAWVSNVRPATFSLAVVPTQIRWSPSASTFAFIGASVREQPPAAFTVQAGQKNPEAVAALKFEETSSNAEILTAEDIQWSSTGQLLVYGYAGTISSVKAEVSLKDVRGYGRDNNLLTERRDWWIISSPDSYHNLTRDMAQPPPMLFRVRNSNLMFSASSGRVWSIDTSSRTTKALTVFEPASASILWPRVADAYRPAEHLIVSHSTAGGADLLLFDLSEAAPLKLATMPQGARFSDYSPHRQLLAYETEVTELRAAGNQKEPITLVSLNRHLDAIAKPQYRTFKYRTAEGKELSAALLLPYGYIAGRRYPMVVSVYGGSVPPNGNWASPYRVQTRGRIFPDPFVFSGHGYAVLIPSIPLSPMGVASDPMLELDKGVIPAIDKVVEMGLADPDRIGLMGHSYGGYSVYGLVTQTGRFKAAVAMSGFTDLFSHYGRIDPRHRFSDVPNPLWGPFLVEGQQPRMGVPPWKDLDRYVRNSPYLHADKVTTPLLMMHGDLDSLPLSEAEQFFVALNRMGKRAKLVRYLGEGHSFES